MQSVRDVLRQRRIWRLPEASSKDAIRAGCAEAKLDVDHLHRFPADAIRAGCAEA